MQCVWGIEKCQILKCWIGCLYEKKKTQKFAQLSWMSLKNRYITFSSRFGDSSWDLIFFVLLNFPTINKKFDHFSILNFSPRFNRIFYCSGASRDILITFGILKFLQEQLNWNLVVENLTIFEYWPLQTALLYFLVVLEPPAENLFPSIISNFLRTNGNNFH